MLMPQASHAQLHGPPKSHPHASTLNETSSPSHASRIRAALPPDFSGLSIASLWRRMVNMPSTGSDMVRRNEIFQRLKPPCVALSQAVLALNGPRGTVKAVTEQLEALQRTVQGVISEKCALDEKLADYVFFPLSQVLKLSQRVSIRCLELTLSIIALVIRDGWRQHVQQQLAAQVLILCTLLAGKSPSGIGSGESTPELQANALYCIHQLFEALKGSEVQLLHFTGDAQLPQLGQTISTILDMIHESPAFEVQLAGSNALGSVVRFLRKGKVLSNFFPGLVSTLTKILTPQTRQRRSPGLLVNCLDIVSYLFKTIFGDGVSANAPADSSLSTSLTPAPALHAEDTQHLDPRWMETAASQVKTALSNILRLRAHRRNDVQDALERLCLTVLRHCRTALSNCCPLALETVVALSAETLEQQATFDLQMLLSSDQSLVPLLQTVLHDHLQSMTRIMQSNDEEAKGRRLHQIGVAYRLLVDSGTDLTTIHRSLAQTLQESVVVTLHAAGSDKDVSTLPAPIQSLDLVTLNPKDVETLPLPEYEGSGIQQGVMKSIEWLVKLVTICNSSSSFAADLARSFRNSRDDGLVGAFWLLLSATRTALERDREVDAMVHLGDLGNGDVSPHHERLEELYSLALSILANSADELANPRLQLLALQTLELRAEMAGDEFRYELVDALYPVLHTLATPNEQLQRNSIAALNTIARACNYGSVKELLVENVDYLTNAVALKLNAFDVSPQAPQVLLMMVRLAGPGLLPYLDDTVESIFAALEDFHGYPVLVELLFKVLAVMAEEGSKAPQLAAGSNTLMQTAYDSMDSWQPACIVSLTELVRERAAQEFQDRDGPSQSHSFPLQPWGDKDGGDDGESNETMDDEPSLGPSHQDQQVAEHEEPPPAPKTYNLLFKITELTQHFLPSASPSLRASLLTLIRTTIPAIAKHENSFLPLINTLWPEIVSRLDDSESHVQATALETIAVLCEYAKDFMRSRIIELWPGLRDVYRAIVKDITSIDAPEIPSKSAAGQRSTAVTWAGSSLKTLIQHMQASPADYSNTTARLLYQAMLDLLTAIARFVPVPPEIFDEALRMVGPELNKPEVADAFERENADAMWLARLKAGAVNVDWAPLVPPGSTSQFVRVGR